MPRLIAAYLLLVLLGPVHQVVDDLSHPLHLFAELLQLIEVFGVGAIRTESRSLGAVDVVLCVQSEEKARGELLVSEVELSRGKGTLGAGNLRSTYSCNFCSCSSCLFVLTSTPSRILRRPSKLML